MKNLDELMNEILFDIDLNDNIEDCKMKIVKFGNLISTDKEWEKKPSKLCDFCDFKDICVNNWAE